MCKIKSKINLINRKLNFLILLFLIVLYLNSMSFATDSIENIKNIPPRPIIETIIGPSLIILGIAVTFLGASETFAKEDNSTGIYSGQIMFANRAIFAGGIGIFFCGNIVTLYSLEKWKKYKRYKNLLNN